MSEDGIQVILEEVRRDLIEIKKDVKLVVAHGHDIARLTEDVERIDSRLLKMEERFDQLEVKEEKDSQDAGVAGDAEHRSMARDEAGGVVGASDAKQDVVNEGFRQRISELFGITGGLQNASLRLFGISLLVAVAVVSILLRAAGL